MTERVRNVFILGLDERNRELLQDLPHSRSYRFHPLLTKKRIMEVEVPLPDLLEEAAQRLESFPGHVDALTGYWDFPVTSMVPILCTRFGLPGPSLESVVRCEHKYWSRLEQRTVTDAHPAFGLIDLDADPHPPSGLDFPLWVKPVKSYSSVLAFKVADQAELDRALAEMREGIGRVGDDFDFLLGMLELPPEIAEAGGRACLVEEEVGGHQVTAEGYGFAGEAHVYGIVDSLCYPDTPSFLRYQYPSTLPVEVQDRIVDISTRVMRQIGLDPGTFNIEFFWDADHDRLSILEINPRLSQSHAPLFALVDGVPNHQCMVQLALGERPEMPRGQGEFTVAAKWYIRTFVTDAVVRRSPGEQEIRRLREQMPDVIVDIAATQGSRLSKLPAQDTYSYELAACYLGARSEEELTEKYRRCTELLPFDLDER
ncbi:hypothetical protein GCM10011581_28020 [Saccharopolyspora subtropica]|uniref:ATP-grasp domain-containing protein n=1 Tax=Saccharopolyspora thermophila TaxID=89367 RepID=A0A917JWD4_9PSEU|nr:ATP-grasp domain-containing protein [Saccharopolyspora subtropica]GGI89370.1 hypothetical protein GCM10011581_28020 [Saccharopolyspora subtropica]